MIAHEYQSRIVRTKVYYHCYRNCSWIAWCWGGLAIFGCLNPEVYGQSNIDEKVAARAEPPASANGPQVEENEKFIVADFGSVEYSRINEIPLDIGVQETGRKVVIKFAVRNDDSKDLQINEISTSCGCTRVSASKAIHVPGSDIPFHVELRPVSNAQEVKHTLTIHFNQRERESIVYVKGSYTDPVKLSPGRPSFSAHGDSRYFSRIDLVPEGLFGVSVDLESVKISKGFTIEEIKTSVDSKLSLLVKSEKSPSDVSNQIFGSFLISGAFARADGSSGQFSIPVVSDFEGVVALSPQKIVLHPAGSFYIGKALLRSTAEANLKIEGLVVDGVLTHIAEDAVDVVKHKSINMLRIRIPVGSITDVANEHLLRVSCGGKPIDWPIGVSE